MNHEFTIMNAAVFVWLVIGVFLRKRHPLHMSWMTFGFAMDVFLLLYIELDRNATGALFAPMGPWLAIHIVIATILIPWYPMLLYSGGKVSAGKPKTFHKWIARTFFILRFLLWVTAVFAMEAKT